MGGCQPPGIGRCITAPDKVSGSRRFYVIIRGYRLERWRRRPLTPYSNHLRGLPLTAQSGVERPFGKSAADVDLPAVF